MGSGRRRGRSAQALTLHYFWDANDVIQLSKSDFGTNPAAVAHDSTQAPGSANTVITDHVNHDDAITLTGVNLRRCILTPVIKWLPTPPGGSPAGASRREALFPEVLWGGSPGVRSKVPVTGTHSSGCPVPRNSFQLCPVSVFNKNNSGRDWDCDAGAVTIW